MATQDLHEGWFYDLAFIRGYQWTYRDRSVGRLQHIPASPWRIRVTDNQTRPLVTHMLALLLERRPTWQALPRGEEEEDLLAAHGYEGLLGYDWERLELTQEYADVSLWRYITGNGIWRVTWNPHAGGPIGVPVRVGEDLIAGKDSPKAEKEKKEPTENFIVAGEPMQPAEESILYEGDVDVQVIPPFNFGVELTATKLERASWCFHESFIHREVLVDRIGSKAEKLVSDVGADEYYAYDRALRFDSGTTAINSESAREQLRVIEFWEAPTKKTPRGRVITVAGGQAIDIKENPYGGRLPFVHFQGNKVPGRFWADGIVRDLVPLQQMHNKALSRYHEIMMLMANPKVIADKGAGLKETTINDRPGEVILKKTGTDVRFLPPPPAPTIHPQIMALAMNSMQMITGVNDPLAGANPPNVRAGITVQRLQEAGMRRFIPIALQDEKSLRIAGRQMLYLHQRFYDEDRIFHVLGADSHPEVYHLKRADIARIMDVTIAHGSRIPKSPAAQQETMMQLLQFAPFLLVREDGQPDSEHVLRVLDMPTARGRVGLKRRQRMRAYREHIEVTEGRPIEVMPFDNDKLHLQLHYGRLSDDKWTEENPEAASALLEHTAIHQVQLMKRQMGEMPDVFGGPQLPPAVGGGAGPMASGGPPPGPGGSPPPPLPIAEGGGE